MWKCEKFETVIYCLRCGNGDVALQEEVFVSGKWKLKYLGGSVMMSVDNLREFDQVELCMHVCVYV